VKTEPAAERSALLSPQAAAAVRQACRILEEDSLERVSLAQLAARVGQSPWHLQRVFRRAIGLTPREYAESRRHRRLREELRRRKVTDALYEAGYGSPSRLYAEADRLGMSPATYRKGGRGVSIRYAILPSPLGLVIVAATPAGICRVTLGSSRAALVAELEREFPEADVAPGGGPLAALARRVVRLVRGEPVPGEFPLDVRATAFQGRVWKELRRIPRGETLSYGEVAKRVGNPRAARAVARACATNPAPFVVPCHRVVAGDGTLGGYGYGVERKAKLLAAEGRAPRRSRRRALP
jgi:AraC family transcriptional regulator of adaptative response/methylated-DNA-[protein]-cysteine methyltransferase